MTQLNSQSRCSEGGFTLVELAIVMIIIGLLIGGILKGQELIKNARVASSVSQFKGFEGAINTFRDKYSAMPGDLLAATATARIPNCAAAPCTIAGSDGDGYIESNANDIGAAQTAFSESTAANVQLSTAGMLSGNVDTNLTTWGAGIYPDFNLGGKLRVGYTTSTNPTGNAGATTSPMQQGHYIMVGAAHNAAMTAGTLNASSAAAVDRKLDDGNPNSGSVRAAGSAGTAVTNCVTSASSTGATPGLYNEALNGDSCGIFYRALQ